MIPAMTDIALTPYTTDMPRSNGFDKEIVDTFIPPLNSNQKQQVITYYLPWPATMQSQLPQLLRTDARPRKPRVEKEEFR